MVLRLGLGVGVIGSRTGKGDLRGAVDGIGVGVGASANVEADWEELGEG